MQNLNKVLNAHRFLFITLIIYLIVRVILLNTNYTEWGDTFRMIRAADYLSHGSWPWDEKRWPLYSVLLIPGIWLNAPVFWGRVLSVLISVGSIGMIYAYYLKFISKNKMYALFAALFAAVSSVFGYWSIRVMADPFFALLVLVFYYYFPNFYLKKYKQNLEYWLAALLLAITMTRLEGLFVATSAGLFFLIYSIKKKRFSFRVSKLIENFKVNFRRILIFFIPQVLIYLPWTLYAKVLYKGNVNNNYLDEVETFVFNFERFKYFFTYSIFILVVPLSIYFVWLGIKKLNISKDRLYLIPVGVFILQELLIGFIWTPSLPRIYMPVIPFLSVLLVFGIENFKSFKLNFRVFLIINLVLTFLFAYLQYEQKLYFLGASKLLFIFIIFSNLLLLLSAKFLIPKYIKTFIGSLIFVNVIITSVIIYNQSNVYKSVMKGIEFVLPLDGRIAYSDETGNTEWYLRSKGFYLDPNNSIDSLEEQYYLMKANGVEYLLWTNEFNRKSSFLDPKSDPHFSLIYVYSQPIRDPLDMVADRLNILDDKDYTVFTTKIYKVL